ncbi:peptide chain release factor N(5)-glutamine methyltransferase [Pedobacter sp. SYSU D00535]|uniref:peptide chain release factor N(5)-glutamine methyltransferase n=1 Tax=Pedobacter sp. SYSU D00535 TaxID=2810308 RepID=UPI001A962E76|nr:peptide chain release factor N(5)-glutamine methyltransferase [Pedobacter sp. SYSU D00535]
MTLAEIESIYIEQLPPMYERDEAKNLAGMAIEHVCGLSRSFIMLHKAHELTMKEETSLIRVLDELRFGIPLQYVLGEADFYGLKLKVNSSVLIPRPETEELVHWVIQDYQTLPESLDKDYGISVLDIGTGSGCIPIAIKKNLPHADVSAFDISDGAIETAIQNAVSNQTEVHFFKADVLDTHLNLLPLTFNVIISNPPYIMESEKEQMHKNVLDHEPASALFVPNDDPLVFYKRIADFSLKHLNAGGALFLEINERLGSAMFEMLNSKGFEVELRKDAQGKDRMVKAVLN